MPHSDERLRPWILEELRRHADPAGFTAVADIGAGAGTWLDFLKPHTPQAWWMAFEVWFPYVETYGLCDRYDQVIIGDIREQDPLPEADLYVFGDVLEHMPADDAVALWDRARVVASWLVINLPVLRYEQGPLFGNPHEVHVHHWDLPSVLESFEGIVAYHGPMEDGSGSVVGAFIARGTCTPA